jgi:hypothetical protein
MIKISCAAMALAGLIASAAPVAAQTVPGLGAPPPLLMLSGPPPGPNPPRDPSRPPQPPGEDRASAAFALVDYFDYPEPMPLAMEQEPMIGMGNEALWECLETRAAKIAKNGDAQKMWLAAR